MTRASELPTIRLFEHDYYVDTRLQQLRNTSDPHDFMNFSEFEAMIQLATLSIRHSGGAEAHPELTKALFQQASDYDRATGAAAFAQEQDLFEPLKVQMPTKRATRKLRL